MFERLPDWVDPVRLAVQAREISGFLPLSEMPRLAPVLTDTAGRASARFVFARETGRHDRVEGRIQATLHLRCERCLETMDWPVDQAFAASLVSGDTAVDGPADEDDMVRVEAQGLSLHTLLEDELLLSLPIVALHPPGTACAAVAHREFGQGDVVEARRESGDNPFSVLKSLKNDEEDH